MRDHARKPLWAENWQQYVTATVLEITCCEAPFLVSRQDLADGAFVPTAHRVVLLDRMLQAINEHVHQREEWLG